MIQLTSDQIIIAQIQQLPDALKKEVIDFVDFLVEKHQIAKQSKPSSQRQPKGDRVKSELEEAIMIVKAGFDKNCLGDTLDYQKASEAERSLPYRDCLYNLSSN